jgi:hypothetical protein
MRLTIEVGNTAELEKVFMALKSMNIESVQVVPTEKAANGRKSAPVITKGDKKIDPKALFGIWKDNPRTLEQLRAMAWDRNWSA